MTEIFGKCFSIASNITDNLAQRFTEVRIKYMIIKNFLLPTVC